MAAPPERSIVRGNLHLTVFPTDHTAGGWENNGQALTSAIAAANIVIPEYFPPEYEGLTSKSSYLRAMDTRDNRLFHEVARVCVDKRKDVWVLDPAHGAHFIALRYLPLALVTGGMAKGAVEIGKRLPKPSVEQNIPISRRRFLEIGGAVAFVAMAEAGTPQNTNPVDWLMYQLAHLELGPFENEIRERWVGKFLGDLAISLKKPTNALIIYTPSHMENILKHLGDYSDGQDVLGDYKLLAKVPILGEMFQMRSYPKGVV